MISLTSSAPSSSSPLATFFAAPAPSAARSALRCASSAMPSLCSAFRKEVPLAPSFAQVSDLAASTARFSASGELRSGFAAPLRTIRPTAERAIGVSVPPAIFACFARSAMIGRFMGSPVGVTAVYAAEKMYLDKMEASPTKKELAMAKKSDAMKRRAKARKNLARARKDLARYKRRARLELARHGRALKLASKRYRTALRS